MKKLLFLFLLPMGVMAQELSKEDVVFLRSFIDSLRQSQLHLIARSNQVKSLQLIIDSIQKAYRSELDEHKSIRYENNGLTTIEEIDPKLDAALSAKYKPKLDSLSAQIQKTKSELLQSSSER